MQNIEEMSNPELLALSGYVRDPLKEAMSQMQYGDGARGLQITIQKDGDKFTAVFVHLIMQNGYWAQLPIGGRNELSITTADYKIAAGAITYQRQIAL